MSQSAFILVLNFITLWNLLSWYDMVNVLLNTHPRHPNPNKVKYWVPLWVQNLTYVLTMQHLINSLWHSDAIWQHRTGTVLVQVMVWCQMIPSHYLNQSWLLINEVLHHSPESILTKSSHELLSITCSEITLSTLLPHLPEANEFTSTISGVCHYSTVCAIKSPI